MTDFTKFIREVATLLGLPKRSHRQVAFRVPPSGR